MGDAFLPSLIVLLTGFAIVSAAVLVRAAILRPHVGALTERAILAVALAVFGVAYSSVALNNELAAGLWTYEMSVVIVRLGVVVLLSIPGFWTYLYLTGRLK